MRRSKTLTVRSTDSDDGSVLCSDAPPPRSAAPTLSGCGRFDAPAAAEEEKEEDEEARGCGFSLPPPLVLAAAAAAASCAVRHATNLSV